ncbi:MAG: hypothetical protein L3J63_12230 [Geopsychrobacter sp.]|nr:hypothetical protein [Geopsychrobacter sp.]
MNHPELTVDLTAEELVRLRFTALKEQNFLFLYASYHPRSPFLELFPHADIYLEFAVQNLAPMRLCASEVGASRATAEGVELICMLRFELDGKLQTMYELALLEPIESGWRYHSAQKLSAEDYQGEFAALEFIHFDHQSPKVRF